MPRYKVTAPDGSQHYVNAPEGATQDQALDYFKQNWKPAEPSVESLRAAFLKAHDSGHTENAAFLAKQIRAREAKVQPDVFQKLAGSNDDGNAQGREDFMRAAWHHASSLPLGAAQLVANVLPGSSGDRMNEYMRGRENEYRSKIGDSAAGDLGAVMGELPSLLAGGAMARPVVAGAAKAAGYMPKAGGAIQKAVNATGEGAAIGAMMPKTGADEDFWGSTGEQALIGGALQPAIAGGAKLLGKAVASYGNRNAPRSWDNLQRPMTKAEELAKAMPGLQVPAWKDSEGVLRNFAEGAKAMPQTKAAMNQMERQAFEQYNQQMVARGLPPTPVMDEAGNVLRWEAAKPSGAVGQGYIDEAANQFNQAYGALHKGRTIPLGDEYMNGFNGMVNELQSYKPDLAPTVVGRLNMIQQPLTKGMQLKTQTQPARQLDTLTNTWTEPAVNQSGGHVGVSSQSMQEAISAAHGEAAAMARDGQHQAADYMRQYARQLENARMAGLPPEVASQAEPINNAFRNFAQYRQGMNTPAAQKQGYLTPDQHLRAIMQNGRKYGGVNQSASGNLPNQREATLASQVLGSRLPDIGPGTAEKAFTFASMLNPKLMAADFLASRVAKGAVMKAPMPGRNNRLAALPKLLRGAPGVAAIEGNSE